MAAKQVKCKATVKCFVGGQLRQPGEEFTFTGDPKNLPKHVEQVGAKKSSSGGSTDEAGSGGTE